MCARLISPVIGAARPSASDEYVDEIVVIDEAEIHAAWVDLVELSKLAAEPAAAVSLAAVRNGTIAVTPNERVLMIMCGGNADFAKLYPGGAPA